MQNSLFDPYITSQYHQEYLTLINRYSDFKRTGPFIRYYNINYENSIRHDVINSSFDVYNISDIKFDIYELTPIYNIAPIINTTSNQPEKIGQIFDGITTVTIHTIDVPRIHDLITFYDPIKSGEIFRVINIRTGINAYYSDPKLTWYEMDLEVAPIKDTSQLKIYKHYVYDIHKEKYYNYTDYKNKLEIIEQINQKINILENFYSLVFDFYHVNDIVPFFANDVILYFKDRISQNNSVRLFNDLKKPYGFQDRFPSHTPDYNTSNIELFDLSINDFIDPLSIDNSDLDTLISTSVDLYELISSNDNYF